MDAEDNRPLGARVTLDMVGSATPEAPIAWTERDAMLYALGVGASMDDAFADLHYTTENSERVALKAVPSFLTVLALGQRPASMAHLDIARFLHAEQRIELVRPLPPSGEGFVSSAVESVLDKGAGAFVTTVTTLRGADDPAPIARSYNTIFVRGGGGFGGPRGTQSTRAFPDRAPDLRISQRTRPDQALLYRLNGDRNPLHSDPVHARERGFRQPILHGLCTYGFSCRALVDAIGGDPDRLRTMAVRLSKPVYPGETLTTEIWTVGEGELLFRTVDAGGDAVLDRGAASFG